MEYVIVDSSTWISYFAEDCHSQKARKFFSRLLNKKDQRIILVPQIIYLEVMNNLLKLNTMKPQIQIFKNMFKLKGKLQLVKTDEKIYLKAERLAKKVRLKTLDLLILTTVHHLRVDHFYTFDKKLQEAYNLISNL